MLELTHVVDHGKYAVYINTECTYAPFKVTDDVAKMFKSILAAEPAANVIVGNLAIATSPNCIALILEPTAANCNLQVCLSGPSFREMLEQIVHAHHHLRDLVEDTAGLNAAQVIEYVKGKICGKTIPADIVHIKVWEY